LNKNGSKLIDFATYNNTRITNTFYTHKDIHKYTWSGRNYRYLIDYFLANEKTAKMFLVFRGLEIDSDHCLVQVKLRFPQRWYNTGNNNIRRPLEDNLFYKVKLLSDSSIRWLFQRRINSKMENININNDIEKEWENLKTIIHNAANENLGKYRKYTPKKKLPVRDEEIKSIISNKNSI
jgi:hypothetical protein